MFSLFSVIKAIQSQINRIGSQFFNFYLLLKNENFENYFLFFYLLFVGNPRDFLEQFFNLPLFFESYLNTVLLLSKPWE